MLERPLLDLIPGLSDAGESEQPALLVQQPVHIQQERMVVPPRLFLSGEQAEVVECEIEEERLAAAGGTGEEDPGGCV